MRKRKSHEDFVREIYHLVGDEYKVLGEYVKSKIKIEFYHVKCATTFEMLPPNFLFGQRCPNCRKSKKKTHQDFTKDVFNLVGDEYSILGNYINSATGIKMKHNNCGCVWTTTPNNFLSGHGCPECGGTRQKTHDIFIKEVFNLVKNEYSVLGEYVRSHDKVLMRHNSNDCDFYEYHVTPAKFLTGRRCPKCFGCFKKTQEEFEDEVRGLTGDEYEVLGEYIGDSSIIKMKHVLCHHEYYVRPSDFIHKNNRCPNCKSSKGEDVIRRWLDINKLKYETQYRFDDCKYDRSLPFDFFILLNNETKILIEYDGRQHFMPVEVFGGDNEFEKVKIRDQIKNEYCEKNNIPLLRIPYWEFDNIEEILQSQLIKNNTTIGG